MIALALMFVVLYLFTAVLTFIFAIYSAECGNVLLPTVLIMCTVLMLVMAIAVVIGD